MEVRPATQQRLLTCVRTVSAFSFCSASNDPGEPERLLPPSLSGLAAGRTCSWTDSSLLAKSVRVALLSNVDGARVGTAGWSPRTGSGAIRAVTSRRHCAPAVRGGRHRR